MPFPTAQLEGSDGFCNPAPVNHTVTLNDPSLTEKAGLDDTAPGTAHHVAAGLLWNDNHLQCLQFRPLFPISNT